MNELKVILHQIEEEQGIITPESVVEKATPEDSPIHHLFEWDDTEAAREYRIWQARQVIKTVKVEIEGKKQNAFFNVVIGEAPNKKQGYVSLTTIVQDRDLYTQMLENAVKEINNVQRKYSDLSELQEIINAERLAEIEAQLRG